MHRDATAVEVPPSATPNLHSIHGLDPAAMEAVELELAEVGEVPAWRELWYGSLDALHREPTINNTHEDVLVQLGAVAFLHCPVRNLGERGVRIFYLFTCMTRQIYQIVRILLLENDDGQCMITILIFYYVS